MLLARGEMAPPISPSLSGSQGLGHVAPTPLPTELRPADPGLGTGQPCGGSTLVALEQVPSNHQPLDLTGAFIDLGDACIAVVPLSWHICHVAHAT